MPPRTTLVRETVLSLWRECRQEDGFATAHIARAFRRDRRLGSHERRLVAEALYGMLRSFRRLEFALEPCRGALAGPAEQDLALFLAWRVLNDALPPAQAGGQLDKVDWEEVRAVDSRIAGEPDPIRRFGLLHSLPDWLAARLLDGYGDQAGALAEALNSRAPMTIRANTLRISRDDLAPRLAEERVESTPTRFAPDGLHLSGHMNVFSLAAFREGLFEVQDEASQLAALVVAPPPGGLVADVCAGAGGKTLALSALMRNKGRILALDVSPSRLQELVRRGRRAGVSNARSVRTPHGAFPPEVESLRGKFVRVLADVPCSGFGALRRNPEARWNTTPEDLLRFPPLQEALARRALGLLAPNGRLVYATCTLFREENEGVVERLLASVPGLELVRVVEILGKAMAEPLCDPTGTYLRLLPHVHGCDGFFCAVLRVK